MFFAFLRFVGVAQSGIAIAGFAHLRITKITLWTLGDKTVELDWFGKVDAGGAVSHTSS